jgi:hypothetical protein
MTKRLTDRDMLVRTMQLTDGPCCGFFACPGPDHRPVSMASCAQATAAYELRAYLQRHGGYCPEHGQDLDQCHPESERPAALGYHPSHGSQLCYCAPVDRTKRA